MKSKNTEALEKNLADYQGEDRIVTSYELKAKLTAVQAEPTINAYSGIPGIDHACEGFRDGEVIVISGPTKNGKTLLAQTLTTNFAKRHIYSTWFSFEVPARQFLSQFPVLPLIHMPLQLKPKDIEWFKERTLEAFQKFGTRIVFIDHLHYLVDMVKRQNLSIEIGAIIRELKTFAVANNFVIFLLCHTTKPKADNEMSYADIRDSSFVAQESDCCIMVKRYPKIADNVAKASIEYHRRTGVMERVITLEKKGGGLVERIETEEEEEPIRRRKYA